MKVRYQAWALPGFGASLEPFIAHDTRVRAVTIDTPSGKKLDATLLEFIAEQESLNSPKDAGMRALGRAFSLISFAFLTPFSVFSARVIPDGLLDGVDVAEIAFAGTPPGIALFESRLGFPRSSEFETDLLATSPSSEVEAAISWFLLGLTAVNSMQQAICYWIGLESLAPLVTGPWQCASCEGDVPACPHCGAATVGPKTVRSIQQYLRATLGVEKKEYQALYDLRCRISHGNLAMNLDGLQAASDKVVRIQELLLQAIKREIGWPVDGPPTIHPEGLTIIGFPGLRMHGKGGGQRYYDHPSCWPPNM